MRVIDNVTFVTATEAGSATGSINTNGRYGYLVAAKGMAQFICNPFVGLIVTRYAAIGICFS